MAIDGLACGKAPGKDGIPLEFLKHGKQTILQPLHELLCLCWEQGHIPQNTRDANIVTLYNIARLRAKTKAHLVLIRELLFADDAALTSHSEEDPQHLVDKLSHACKEFGLTISLRKTNILAQGAVPSPPKSPQVITIDNLELGVVDTFTYLGSTMSSSTSLDAEISCKRVWGNDLLSESTKICIYQACVLSALLYGSELWMTYARQERRLNGFHLRCLRRLLYIRWQDRVTNTEFLECAGSVSMPSLLIQQRLRCLSQVNRMEPDRLPREILYGELREGVCGMGQPLLHYKDDTCAWEDITKHRDTWRQSVKAGVSKAEANARVQATCKRATRKESAASARVSTRHVCATCNRDCRSRIGLHSHTRSCPNHQR